MVLEMCIGLGGRSKRAEKEKDGAKTTVLPQIMLRTDKNLN